MQTLSAGVLVTDGRRLLIGHATATTRWDIPKGLAEPGEPPRRAAARELLEETGLHAAEDALLDLGKHRYRPGKTLAVFAWRVAAMPDLAGLRCTSTFTRNGRTLPEMDRFACPPWQEALATLIPAMAAVLAPLGVRQGWG